MQERDSMGWGLTARVRNVVMTFSRVCSYSRMRALSWRLSLRSAWFSADMAAFMRSSSAS